MEDGVIVFTTKELLEKIDGKLDRLDTKLDSKADSIRVEAMIETLKTQVFAELRRVEALVVPLIDPKTGVYSLIESSRTSVDRKTTSLLGTAVVLLAGVLFKKYLGLA